MSMEEPIECPLCMEPLEMDDICFFPCTCGYQICRFCWHRIRTDENGLCPACRKPYQEDPAEFKPLTEEELQRIKKERRQKDLQRKQKAAENRKHLANVRVVQKNLVFVVGLSQRLADPDALKKHEYFGKYGKIHKVVINQSTSYAGAQGPSASAYVTYNRPEDALRAIQAVNNIFVDGRTIKASLGTTKYCSHFLRGAQCPKPDCMYLHELGEEAASFTKEEMQQGKHQEYEQKLYEMYVTAPQLNPNSTSTTSSTTTASTTSTSTTKEKHSKRKNGSPVMGQQPHPPHQTNKDAWPSLGNNGKSDRVSNGHKAPPQNSKSDSSSQNRTVGNNRNRHNISPQEANGKTKAPSPSSQNSQPSPPLHTSSNSTEQLSPPIPTQKPQPVANSVPRKVPFSLDNADSSLSLFSSNGFPTVKKPPPVQQPPQVPPDSIPTTEISDSIPVTYATDWQAAFGFGSSTTNTETHEDDLGFDPWRESSKALADLIEKEATTSAFDDKPKSTVPPPGFTSNHFGAYNNSLRTGIEQQSKMLRLLSLSSTVPSKPNAVNTYNDVLSEYALQHRDGLTNNHIQNNDAYNMKDWQEGLRALLPNINISFGGATTQHQQTAFPQPNRTQTVPAGFSQPPHFTQSPPPQMQAQPNKQLSQPANTDLTWDPAIVSSGNVTENNHADEPHWMASLQHLTEVDPPAPNHRFPYMQSFPFRAPTWGAQTQHPPPGFQTPLRTPAPMPETQKLAGGLQ